MTPSDIPHTALIALGVSAVGSCLVTVLVWRREDPLFLKVVVTAVAFLPVIGPLFALWVCSFPDRMHPALQAKYKNTVNFYSVPKRKPVDGDESKGRSRDAA